MIRSTLVLVLTSAAGFASAAGITDLTEWTRVEDPPHPNIFSGAPSESSVTITANGAVPSGTDLGWASVNGADVATSTAGYYFDPSSDFSIAIDYNLTLTALEGGGGIGLGIGEDVGGSDSAGIGLGFANLGIGGDILLFGTAGRVDDVDLSPSILNTAGTLQGRFFVEYFAAAGDVTVGVSPTPGAASPTETRVLAAIQNQWDDEPLLVSFFLRSQTASLTSPVPVTVPAMTSGTAGVTFRNFTVLSGSPIAAVPEPTTTGLAVLGALGALAVPPKR